MIGKVTITEKCLNTSNEVTPGEWKTIPHKHLGTETGYLCIQFGDEENYTSEALKPADATMMAASKELYEVGLIAQRWGAWIEGVSRDMESTPAQKAEFLREVTFIQRTLAKAEGKEAGQ